MPRLRACNEIGRKVDADEGLVRVARSELSQIVAVAASYIDDTAGSPPRGEAC
jgi:hypothetical protein